MELFQILATTTSGDTVCDSLQPIIAIIKSVLLIIQIGIPIILILMGTIDLGKAVLSSDDKAIKESTSKLIKRVIAAVAVFFVVTIIKLIMSILGNATTDSSDNSSWLTCWNKVSEGTAVVGGEGE